VDEKVEAKMFWPSEGEYLQKYISQALPCCVFGYRIPDKLIADQAFDGSSYTARDTEAAMTLAAEVRDHQRGPDVVSAIMRTI
jgi:hypothetical protein